MPQKKKEGGQRPIGFSKKALKKKEKKDRRRAGRK